MLLGALAAEWSLSLLAHCAVHHNLKNFSGITNAAGGPYLTAFYHTVFSFLCSFHVYLIRLL